MTIPDPLQESAAPAAGPRDGVLWLLFALLATCVVYWQSLGGELVYDDLALIGENALIGDLGNLPELLSRPLWDFQNPGSSEQTGYWRPLTSVAYALSWALDGGATWAFHAASILFHLTATAAAFLLARRLSGQGWVAGAVALLFGLHPLHVESVAWISALNDPLFSTFLLFSLASFAGWRQRGSKGLPLLAALGFCLALLSKEMALATIPLLVLVDLFVGRPSAARGTLKEWFVLPRSSLRAYLPFALVLALYLGLRMWVFASPKAGFDRVITHFGVAAERMALLRVELWGGGLRMLFWPGELKLFRPFQPNLSLGDATAQLALVITLASIVLVGLLLFFRRRSLFFAFLLIPISFLPVLWGADAVGLFPFSDRYLYLAVFGSSLFSILLLGGLAPRRAVQGLVLLVALLFGRQSFERCGDWQSELQLFRSEAQDNPRSPYVYWGYGRVLLNEYSKTDKKAYLEQAKVAFENSQALLDESKTPAGQDIFASSNDYLQANLGYAHCYIIEETLYSAGGAGTSIALLTNLLEAVGKIHQEAAQAEAQGKTVKGFLPPIELVLSSLGAAHYAAGDWDQAAEHLLKSLVHNPRNIQALKTLAKVDIARNDKVSAIANLRKGLLIAPRNGDLLLALAQILQDAGNTREAQEIAEDLLEILPDHPGPLWVLADGLMQANKPREALIRLREAQRIDEFNGHTWLLIGQAMNAAGLDPSGMLDAFRKAALYKPGDVKGHYNLAALLYTKGELQEAIPHFARAYALATDPQLLNNLRTVLQGLDFHDPSALMRLSQADWARKQFDLVEFWLNKALVLDPEHLPALMDMGRTLMRRGRVEEALAFMQRATKDTTSFTDLLEFAQFQAEAGQVTQAKLNIERARKLPLTKAITAQNRQVLIDRLLESLNATDPADPSD